MAKSPDPWAGWYGLPGAEQASAYQVLAPEAYVQVEHQIEKTDEAAVGCGRNRIRRAPRALRDKRFRQPRGNPPLCAVRINGGGPVRARKSFAEECMAEYDLKGWTVPDLVNPDDVNALC
jgi:hypothetical protein